MKRWRHEENDRTAEKKRWRLGEWRRVGWWFRREGKAKRMLRERERENSALGFRGKERERESLNLIRGEREGERAVGMCAFKYINFTFFTKPLQYICLFSIFLYSTSHFYKILLYFFFLKGNDLYLS